MGPGTGPLGPLGGGQGPGPGPLGPGPGPRPLGPGPGPKGPLGLGPGLKAPWAQGQDPDQWGCGGGNQGVGKHTGDSREFEGNSKGIHTWEPPNLTKTVILACWEAHNLEKAKVSELQIMNSV